ncbi:hypothetical protein TNCT_292431 [Trichonephila clavata]|uniref:Uncharacterized protein n=1 Tax=Trichonephila clavata TaxID=2740835 RepID=A0A8X6F123_TRICU|nr:hypothetical protein TNCT_292431 [Trichonephila clavata]
MDEIILFMNSPRRAGSRGQKMDEVEKRVHIHTTAINAFSLPLATGLEEPALMGKVSLKGTVPKGLCHPLQTTSQRSRGGIGFVARNTLHPGAKCCKRKYNLKLTSPSVKTTRAFFIINFEVFLGINCYFNISSRWP